MSVFESTIKMLDISTLEWYIELRDVLSGRVEICKDLEEYSHKLAMLASLYEEDIDEVRWSKDDNVHPAIIDAIRLQMQQVEQELETSK